MIPSWQLGIEDIAQQAGMSTSSLHQRFRGVAGVPPAQLVKVLLSVTE